MMRRRHRSRWTMTARREQPLGSMSLLGLVGSIALAGLIAGLCFLYLWQGHRLQEYTAALDDLNASLQAEQAVNRILEVRIDEAFSLERIARIAREDLRMAEPDPEDILYVQTPID